MKKRLVASVVLLAALTITVSLLLASLNAQTVMPVQANGSPDPSNAFLKIDGVDGESTDANHTGWIDILSYNWQVSHTAAAGASFGFPRVDDFCFDMKANKASPKLLLACANGKVFKFAILAVAGVVSSDGQVQDFLNYTFNNVVISSYQTGLSQGGGDAFPVDHFCIAFGSVTIDYIKYSSEPGVGIQHYTVTWDLRTNKGT